MVLVSVHDQLALLLWACSDTQQWEWNKTAHLMARKQKKRQKLGLHIPFKSMSPMIRTSH
jgi:hypothetical protein